MTFEDNLSLSNGQKQFPGDPCLLLTVRALCHQVVTVTVLLLHFGHLEAGVIAPAAFPGQTHSTEVFPVGPRKGDGIWCVKG